MKFKDALWKEPYYKPCCCSVSKSCPTLWTWTAAHQASLSLTNSWSLLKLMPIESVMPSNHLILCRPFLLLPSIFPSSGSFPMSQLFASDDLDAKQRQCIKPRQCVKKQRHHFPNKGPYSQNYSFSSSHVRMWELDCKEDWAQTSWCFRTVVLEKTPENPLDHKEIKLVNPKGNQPWIFTGRTDAKAEAPILLATCCDELTHWKRLWCWERLKAKEKREAEDEMVR